MEGNPVSLKWTEYIVFAGVLGVSTAIGIFFGFQSKKQSSSVEFLLAGRKMSAWPVSLSLVCSWFSAISMLGSPMETYLFGTQIMVCVLSFIPLSLSLSYLYLPVFFNVQVHSAYEYIEIRFNSKLRTVVSVIAVVQTIVIMAATVYAPSLAIQQVTGISSRVSTAVICAVCIFYSAVGGLKAVVWTDVFQAFIMMSSILVTVITGVNDAGGLGSVWQTAEDQGRIVFLNFDVDPRTRHTIWTEIIGNYFHYMPVYAASQIQIQRFLSMPDISEARKSVCLNGIILLIIYIVVYGTGLVILAVFLNCDPLTSKKVSLSDQVVPYFVVQSVQNIPGLIGLFIAGITCASMSTLSSGLSALTSILTYDFINKIYPKMPDWKLSLISKINCLLFGIVTYAFIFAVENMGNVVPMAYSVVGVLAGPILGLFSLGMFFPSVNSKGVLTGAIATMFIMLAYVIAIQVHTNQGLLPDQRLPLSADGCEAFNLTATTTTSSPWILNYTEADKPFLSWKDRQDSFLIQFLSVSYMWYPAMGTCLSMLLGLIMSWVFELFSSKRELVKQENLSPAVVWLWGKLFPGFLESRLDLDPTISATGEEMRKH